MTRWSDVSRGEPRWDLPLPARMQETFGLRLTNSFGLNLSAGEKLTLLIFWGDVSDFLPESCCLPGTRHDFLLHEWVDADWKVLLEL